MSAPKTIRGRYELGTIIGRGGMGVVHKARDNEMKRDVAVKMLHDVSSQAVLDLFYRECDILRSLVHPNVIDILDMGDFNDEGVVRPYYVMPLLPGKTLYDLLHPGKDLTEPLSVDRASEIIVQTARGLHAAHERELLHRDVKPRNIFVIDEYSVKLIDFGVAHLLGSTSSSGIKGTLEYMAPEQLKMKMLSRRTDIFSLATVSYEILTGRQPFRRATDGETAEAVTTFLPPLASDLNASVPKSVAQVIHKAMAKEPLSRFATAAEFADALQRARRNEPMSDLFSANEDRSRRDKVRQSIDQKDFLFASEVLQEIEVAGQADSEVRDLRRQIDQALLHQNTSALYEAAERYYRADEYQLALRKVQEVLDLDKTHSGALVLRRRIEDYLNDRKIIEALDTARERMRAAAFTDARRVLQDARKLRPDDTRIRELLLEVDTKQKEFLKQRQEFERIYQSAQASWVQRDISQAMVNLERLKEFTQKIAEPRDRIMEYESFYKVVRTEYDSLSTALEHATKKVADEEYTEALALCSQYLTRYPRHAGFTALRTEIENIQRSKQEALRADVELELAQEPSLSRKVQILENARNQYPLEEFYSEELQRIRSIQIEVDSIVESAQIAEDSGDLEEALAQWNTLTAVYPEYPGLDDAIGRLSTARSRAEEAQKHRLKEDFDRAIRNGRVDDAELLLEKAAARFPGEFDDLRKRLEEERFRKNEARRLLAEARKLGVDGRTPEALNVFRKAIEKDESDTVFRKTVVDSLVDQAKWAASRDWKDSKQYLQAARSIDSSMMVPPAVMALIDQAEQADYVGGALMRALEAEKSRNLDAALQEINSALARYPEERLLREKRAGLEAAYEEFSRQRERAEALDRCRDLNKLAETGLGAQDLARSLEELRGIAKKYNSDQEIKRAAIESGQHFWDLQQANAKVAAGDLEGARAIAAKYLQQIPGHNGFTAIQDQIVELERQAAVEFMAEVDGLLFREPNIEKRIQVLEEACKRYPSESHYSEELEMVRSEQAMVQSTAAEAEALEKAGKYKEALDQWNRMGAIYRSYPGLDEQIARLTGLNQQAADTAKSKWTEQIEKSLGEFNYPQAQDQLRRARIDFPNEFADLAKRAKEGADRRSQGQQRIAEAQEFAARNRWEECRLTLQSAVDAAAGDPAVRKQAVEAHAKHARLSVKSDLKATEALLQQAAALDSGFKVPDDIRAKIEQLKRSEFVDLTIGRAQQQRQAGELKKALATIRAAQDVYPKEPKLIQWRTEIETDLREAEKREERQHALDELKHLESTTRQINDPKELREIIARAEGIAKKDSELSVLTDELRQQMQALENGGRLIEEGKLDDAEAIITEMLNRFGEYSAFNALQQRLQNVREQAAKGYRRDVARRLETEPTFEARIKLLEEAAREYPKDPYYTNQMARVHSERERVRALAAEADALEKSGRFEEALDRWNKMSALFPPYPDLAAHIDRVTKTVQGKQEEAAAIERARMEEAARREKEQREEAARQEQTRKEEADRRNKAQQRLNEAQDAAAKGRWDDCRAFLRQAIAEAPGEQAIFKQTIEAHSKHAKSAMKTAWKAAEALLDQAAEIDPSFKASSELRTRIDQLKRSEFVEQTVAKAREQQKAGDLGAALETVRGALAAHPDEPNLLQAKSDIEHRQEALRLEEADKADQAAARAYFEQLEQKLETEGDTTRREAILIDALSRYPKQPKFQQDLEAIIKNQQHVVEVINGARASEKAGRYAEALEAWKSLRELYAKYPRLESEIERVGAVKATFEEATKLQAEGRKLFGKKQWAEGSAKYRAAAQKFPQDERFLRGLLEELVKQAGSLLDSDWRAVDPVLRAAHGLNPKHPAVGELWARFEEKQRKAEEEKKKAEAGGADPRPAADAPVAVVQTPPADQPVRATAPPLLDDSPTLILTPPPKPKPEPKPEAKPEPAKVRVLPEPPPEIREGRKIPSFVWIVVAAGVVLGAFLLARKLIVNPGTKPAFIAVTIGTDPQGASIRLADGTQCQTPGCKLQLPPGDYTLTAEKTGYRAAQQALKIDGNKPSESIDITLQPIPITPPKPPQPGVKTGTLVIKAGVADALVLIDKVPSGRTAADGSFTAQLEAKSYDLRLEKNGYEPIDKPGIKIAASATRSVLFVLVQQNAKLEVKGAPSGVDITAGGNRVGRTDGSPSYSITVPLGPQTLQFSGAGANRSRQLEFHPGETLSIEWASILPPKTDTPPPPPPKTVETPPPPADPAEQAWAQVRNSNNAAEIEAYIQRYPNSPHIAELNQRLDNLAWTSTNQNDPGQVRAYARNFPRGAHLSEAKSKIQELAWNAVDKTNPEAVRIYTESYPDSPFKSAAASLIDQLQRQGKQDADKAAAAKALEAQKAQLQAVLEQFNTAWAKRQGHDLKQIWPSIEKKYSELVDGGQGSRRTVMKLDHVRAMDIKGDSATVDCDLITTNTGAGTPPTSTTLPKKVVLKYTGNRWIIASGITDM